MRVLLTIPDLTAAAGGPSVLVTRLAAALHAEGDTVQLLFGERPGQASVPIPAGMTAVCLPWQANPWRRYRQFGAAVSRLIREHDIEVLHDHGLWLPENAAAASAAQAAGLPWLSQPCGMLQDWSVQQQRLKKRLAWALYQRRLLGKASALIAASPAEARETSARLPRALAIHCIAHGVDLPVLDATVRQRQAVFLGRLHPVKQVDVLLKVWAALRPADWQLLIAGGGEPAYQAQLRAQATALGLDGSVRFLGPVHGEDKRALLATSQLFLQPSQQENFGLAVVEALAHGLPAVTTTAMPWSALPGAGCGWSVGSDAAAIRDGLHSALALSAETLAAMGARARQFSNRYSWTETARQTRLVYEQVRT